MEAKRNQAEGTRNVSRVVKEAAEDFEKLSGRKYGLFEEYRMEDAERAVVIIGSAAGTTKDAIDRLREQGEKVGLVKIRLFRPFPADEIAETLKNVKAVAIMDRARKLYEPWRTVRCRCDECIIPRKSRCAGSELHLRSWRT